jgi:hypothetical protein
MKHLIPLVLSLTAATSAFAQVPESDMVRLLAAIKQVESGGDANAIGDQGKALGAYQIWESYWRDAVVYVPSIGGCYQDCKDPKYAEFVVRAYLARYAPKRGTVTLEMLARIHNGGPRGYLKPATLKYWVKIQKVLAQ